MVIPTSAIAILFATFFYSALSQLGPASAPMPPSTDCMTALLNLSSCLTFVEAGSSLKAPDKGCCPGLAGLVDNAPVCLCQLLGSSEVYGLQIDTAKALKLPTVCRVDTPPVSLCSVLGIPVASPLGPAPSPIPRLGSAMGFGTQAASPPSSNHGSPSFLAFDLMLLAGISCAGVIIAIF